MNIFAPYECPIQSARALDNQRIPKMIIESAQLLSTVWRAMGMPDGKDMYNAGWQNHPCTLWLLEGRKNVDWLIAHAQELAVERRYRRIAINIHASEWVVDLAKTQAPVITLADIATPHANCTPYKGMATHYAYQQVLRDKWHVVSNPPNWGRRGPPDFV